MSRQLDYYEEELSYLIEAGREFARTHPEVAKYLSPDNPRARDPHVERLLESFAFLSGRIRMRLDDDFPELVRALLSLVWPHYFKQIPAMATMEFTPREGMIQEVSHIRRGALVDSDPVAGGKTCRFQTAFDVDVYPFRIDNVKLETGSTGNARLRITVQVLKGADLSSLGPIGLQLHLAGEQSVKYDLYRLLSSSVEKVQVAAALDDETVLSRNLSQENPTPAGLSLDHSVLPSDNHSFPGFRLLQEYFLFPEKLLYFHFAIGDALKDAAGAKHFDLIIHLNEAPPKGLRVVPQNFRLHCTPVLNLFERDAEPIRLNRKSSEYRVMADFSRPDDFEVYDVLSVDSIERISRKRHSYKPYFSFHHLSGNKDDSQPFYVATQKPSPTGNGWITNLSFPSQAGDNPEEETISCRLLVTNGTLASKLGVGQIRHPAQGIGEFVGCSNITHPTRPIWPGDDGGEDWKFVSHLGLNLSAFRNLDSFKQMLALYGMMGDRTMVDTNARRIEGVRSIDLQPAKTMRQGSIVRGTEVLLGIDEEHFTDWGDVLLFAGALSEFLALYASINSFVRLSILAQPSGKKLRCQAKFSTRQTL